MEQMKHIEEMIRQVEQLLEQLQPHEQQIVLERLFKKYGSSSDEVMVVGSNYDFWLNPEDDIYDKL